MNFKTYKVHLKLVRSFSLGFSIFSPKLNGFYIELHMGIFTLAIWSRAKRTIGFTNYWSG